ncbi:hypothetical protein B0H17DRAFT_1077141 [Mycena rosella]|uniref:F-box domain-containing protein n=1 Tax=Mycena rosella TaxID=1033263 RepID=A0AAD7G9I6_MYCRO|nr:hypothetical protein B0H17DRAFT_1077141 [Mycena rosella]
MPASESVFLLPPEITSIIFRHCLPSPPNGSGHRYPSPHDAPLLLTQICRQWREFCLDTPDLWASIALKDGCGAGSVQLLKQWLSHSRNRPLTIALEVKDVTRAGELMGDILLHCHRWEDVSLSLSNSSYHQLSMYRGPFPKL